MFVDLKDSHILGTLNVNNTSQENSTGESLKKWQNRMNY